MLDIYPDVLTLGEVAKILRLGSERSARRYVNRHRLGVGSPLRIPKSKLIAHLEKSEEPANVSSPA